MFRSHGETLLNYSFFFSFSLSLHQSEWCHILVSYFHKTMLWNDKYQECVCVCLLVAFVNVCMYVCTYENMWALCVCALLLCMCVMTNVSIHVCAWVACVCLFLANLNSNSTRILSLSLSFLFLFSLSVPPSHVARWSLRDRNVERDHLWQGNRAINPIILWIHLISNQPLWTDDRFAAGT